MLITYDHTYLIRELEMIFMARREEAIKQAVANFEAELRVATAQTVMTILSSYEVHQDKKNIIITVKNNA